MKPFKSYSHFIQNTSTLAMQCYEATYEVCKLSLTFPMEKAFNHNPLKLLS